MIDRATRFAGNALRMRARHGASLRHQWHDFAFLHRVFGLAPTEFYDYRMWDRTRSADERLAYLTFDERRLVEAAFNPVPLQKSLLDKLAITARLDAAGIAVPEVVASYRSTGSLSGASWRTLSGERDLQALASEDWPQGLVIKPNDGGSGRDVHVFRSVHDGQFFPISGAPISAPRFAAALARRPDVTWKIERRALTHRQLDTITPDVLATVRVMSFRHRDGRVMIGPSAWKVPFGRSGVDNYAHGSFAAPIDAASGTIGKAWRSSSVPSLSTHPESGVRFEGMVMPYWSAIQELVRNALDVLPGLHGLGWDVGVTDNGPVIVEANPWWGGRLIQVPHSCGLVQGAFAELLVEFGLGELLQRRVEARKIFH